LSPSFVLQATRLASNDTLVDSDNVLTSRVALMNNCTRGTSPSHCVRGQPSNRTEWGALLRKHAEVYPGKQTQVDYTFFSDDKDDGGDYAYLQFDWDARRVSDRKAIKEADTSNADLLMYSLVRSFYKIYCKQRRCIVSDRISPSITSCPFYSHIIEKC
jgi:hypothetical protein